jgi:hypothetical protein
MFIGRCDCSRFSERMTCLRMWTRLRQRRRRRAMRLTLFYRRRLLLLMSVSKEHAQRHRGDSFTTLLQSGNLASGLGG